MQALYWKAPSAAELAEWKLKAKHYPEPVVTVWADNWDAIQMFISFSSQWRSGPAGVIGLDYSVIHFEANRLQMAGEEFDNLMWQIGVIESEALRQLRG